MSACAAVGCDKHQRRDRNITFFNLPSEKTDKERRLKWVNIIKNKRKDELPKKIVLCERHFSDGMFDESREMQIRMAKLQGKFISSLSNLSLRDQTPYISDEIWRVYKISQHPCLI